MSQSAMKHMGLKARMNLKQDRETRINLHAFVGTKVYVAPTIQAAIEVAPVHNLVEDTIKAQQCNTCWDELHTDHLIRRFEVMRDAKRGRIARKLHMEDQRRGQMLMDWHDEESQADAWLGIQIWDCVAENSVL